LVAVKKRESRIYFNVLLTAGLLVRERKTTDRGRTRHKNNENYKPHSMTIVKVFQRLNCPVVYERYFTKCVRSMA